MLLATYYLLGGRLVPRSKRQQQAVALLVTMKKGSRVNQPLVTLDCLASVRATCRPSSHNIISIQIADRPINCSRKISLGGTRTSYDSKQ